MSEPLALPFLFAFPGGSTKSVHAAADGYVVLGRTSAITGSPSPNVGELMSTTARLAPLWTDLHPSVNLSISPSTGVYFDVDPNNQAAYITWLDVADGPLTVPGVSRWNVQCVLRADGSFEFRYGSCTPGFWQAPLLIGWSQGNSFGVNAKLPGSIDISTAMPFQTTGPDSYRLVLESNLPILGNDLTLTVSYVKNLAPLAFVALGDTQLSGIELAAIGAPGCFSYTNANLVWLTVPVTFGGPTGGNGSTTLPVPNLQALAGMPITCQAFAATDNNTLQYATSNGVSLQLGR